MAGSTIQWMLVVDVEASGPYVGEHFMPELGAVCFEFITSPYSQKEPCMRQIAAFSSVMLPPYGTTWDTDTLQGFWEKKPGDRIGENLFDSIQRRMKDSGETPEVGMNRFAKWLHCLLEYYGKHLIIASDNPAVDISWVNYYLRRYGNSEGLAQLLQQYAGEYRRILDTSSWRLGVRQLSPWIGKEQWMLQVRPSLSEDGVIQPRTHQALADAVDVATSALDVLKYVHHAHHNHHKSNKCVDPPPPNYPPSSTKSWAAVASSPPSLAPIYTSRPHPRVH